MGGKERNRDRAQGETDKSHHDKDHDRLQSILPPDICLSGAPSFSLSRWLFSHFRKKKIKKNK